MVSLKEAGKLVIREIESLKIPDTPASLYEPVRYILSNGGKRIRPSLTLIAAGLFSDDLSSALGPAAGIEVFHNFTLLHDDLMDHSDIRRGKETVHRKWDANIAILSGDVMSIMSHELMSRTDERYLHSVLDCFNRTAREVCEGQMMDMDFETRQDVSIDEYLEMIRLKTSVLIGASLKIGALSVGAQEGAANDLYDFGLNLGLAFQLQDDLLDSYGDTGVFGKKVGNDILLNKKTYLMISALNLANDSDRERLLSIMKEKDFNPDEKIKNVKEIFDRYDIKQILEEKINGYFLEAREKLNMIPLPEVRKKVLGDFSLELMGRNK